MYAASDRAKRSVKKLCGDGIEEAVRHIVGVQFRNQATVGGSIYGRFGFSDVLTAFLALDTYVELYDGGRICLAEFAKKKPDNDLLLFIVVKKKKRQFRYDSIRQTKTDFPVIACSVSREKANGQETWYFAVGARPMKADMIEKKWSVAKDASLEKIENMRLWQRQNLSTVQICAEAPGTDSIWQRSLSREK